ANPCVTWRFPPNHWMSWKRAPPAVKRRSDRPRKRFLPTRPKVPFNSSYVLYFSSVYHEDDMKKFIMIILFLMLLSPLAFAEGCFVRQVQDAKTLTLLNGERVRLIGIDVPAEKNDEATAYLRSLVSGSVVALEYDLER